MEANSEHSEGFLETVTCQDGSGVFTLIYTILALGFLLSIVIFG